MEQTVFDFSWAEPAEIVSAEPVEAIARPPRMVSTMADIRSLASEDGDLTAGRRRDVLSDLTRFAKVADRPLGEIAATAAAVRKVFLEASPVRLGLTKKSLQTMRSTVAFALERYGRAARQCRSKIKQNWNSEWAALVGLIQIPFQRHGLSRLAEYCSHTGIAPADVTVEVLRGFLEALETSEIVKTPKDIVHNTITSWNRAVREISGWPDIILSSPTAPIPHVLPIGDFPVGFQTELTAWQSRVSAKPQGMSIFRDEGLLHPLRPDTVKSHVFMFRQIGTALVKSGAMELHDVTCQTARNIAPRSASNLDPLMG